MYQDAKLIQSASLTLLRGDKINSSDYPGHVIANLQNQLAVMNSGFMVAPEPQSFILSNRIRHIDPKFMGRTDVHPVPLALSRAADYLKSVCVQKNVDVTPFTVLGLDLAGREAWRDSPDFKLEPGKVGVLLSGDIAAMWQINSLIRQRRDDRNVFDMQPVIIQNSGHFWEPLLHTEQSSWGRTVRELKKLNIFYSSGDAETADLLAGFPHMPKIAPQDISFKLAGREASSNSNDLFATGDPIKFGQTRDTHNAISPDKKIRRVSDVLGPSEIPAEVDYTLEGNARAKLKKFYELLDVLQERTVTFLLSQRGFTDINTVNVIINDGGLGFCLENSQGEQMIDLFTPEDFAESVTSINPIQRNPGVELAEYKKTIGHETMMERLEGVVANRVKLDDRFTRDDLTAYDGTVFMSVPLTNLLDGIRKGQDFDLHALGVVSVYAGQKLKVTRGPEGLEPYAVPNTEHYLIPPGESLVRADISNWHMATDAPNVAAFKFLKAYTGVVPGAEIPAPESKIRFTTGMGVLGSRDALTERTSSPELAAIKAMLRRDYDIATGQRPTYWKDFQIQNTAEVLEAAGHDVTNGAYLTRLAAMYERSSVVYIGPAPDRGDPDLAKIITNLAVLEGVVRNQVFRENSLVIDTKAAKDVLDLIAWKQSLGLVLQKSEYLYTPATSPEDAAEKIAAIVKAGRPSVTGLQGKFYSDGQVERQDCMVVTPYLSATNKNKMLAEQVTRLGYLHAVNGFSAKVGGGNEGLMRDFADGFNKGKAELLEKGYDFPNQLILIQCAHTEAIEKRYDGEGIFRSHGDIHPRMADLQGSDHEIGCASGAGGDQEIHASFYSRKTGLIDPQRTPMTLFNQQIKTTSGQKGVHDPYKKMYSESFFKDMNADFVLTVEEVVARSCAHRARNTVTHSLSPAALADTLAHKMNGAANPVVYAAPYKNFRPPFDMYLGPEGDLPQNPQRPQSDNDLMLRNLGIV